MTSQLTFLSTIIFLGITSISQSATWEIQDDKKSLENIYSQNNHYDDIFYAIKYALKRDPSLVNHIWEQTLTDRTDKISAKIKTSALTFALLRDNHTIVELLLDKDADINRQVELLSPKGRMPESFFLFINYNSQKIFSRALGEWIDFETTASTGETLEDFVESKIQKSRRELVCWKEKAPIDALTINLSKLIIRQNQLRACKNEQEQLISNVTSDILTSCRFDEVKIIPIVLDYVGKDDLAKGLRAIKRAQIKQTTLPEHFAVTGKPKSQKDSQCCVLS